MTIETRFAFGRNWRQFLSLMDDERIERAQESLQFLLGVDRLDGKSFLDVGCGSGLFSLAAVRCGATVHSFDMDDESVACARELQTRFAPSLDRWTIEQGSALDAAYLQSLGQHDIVYAWGVLHHTGHMWQALEQVAGLATPGGWLCLAIYNDQGGASRRWLRVKQLYVKSPSWLRTLLLLAIGFYWETRAAAIRIVRLQNPSPLAVWKAKKRDRGMSVWYDLVDWVGGYPFEVARPEEIFDFYLRRGFELQRLTTQGRGHGCNEFVFRTREPLLNANDRSLAKS
jgi:2-polyprenyl-6-hydroxyphenyl methylase/3-demethylubiquinone-9 3-methyltransferase